MSPFHILPVLVVVIGLYLIATKVPWKWLVGALVLGLVGWGVWAFMNREKPAKPITPAATSAAAPPVVSPYSNYTGHCQGPWDVHELDIPAGGLPVQLCWGWSFWPINGPVTLTTKSGKVYKFLPNKEGEIIIPELQMGGMAIFRSVPDGSKRRIAVKNRW